MKIKIILLVGSCMLTQYVAAVEIKSEKFCNNFRDVAFAVMHKRQIGVPIEVVKSAAKDGTNTRFIPVLNRMIDYVYTTDVAANEPSRNELSYQYAQNEFKACLDGDIPEFKEIEDE